MKKYRPAHSGLSGGRVLVASSLLPADLFALAVHRPAVLFYPEVLESVVYVDVLQITQ